jgi:integrase
MKPNRPNPKRLMVATIPFVPRRSSAQDPASRGWSSGRDGIRSPRLPGGKARPSWKRALQDIIAAHNLQHASKDKTVSYKTQHERASAIFRCFRDIRALGFKIQNPYCLGGRHVRAVVQDWTAPQPRTRPHRLSPATIRTERSHLRTYATWIGKPGLVQPAEAYVSDPALVTRQCVATRDKSWRARDIDPDALIAEITAHDAWVGTQLRLARAYGLRVKEAVMLRPWLAERSALPGDDPARPVPRLELEPGTKGGRLRHIPIDTLAKRSALDAAKVLVHDEAHFLADPKRSLVQNLDRLRNVMKRFGVTGRELGVTPHGLRHEYAGDRYTAVAGVVPPVRGGSTPGAATDERARLQVAEELGHSRTQIASAYLGSPRKRRGPSLPGPRDGEEGPGPDDR